MEGLVSIIMPLFNAESFVTEAINSVIEQTYQNWELIVINDGSSDDSLSKVQEITDNRVKIINNIKNVGVAATRNIGISHARGCFLAFLDSDDIWLPTKLEIQVTTLWENHDAVMCCSAYQTFTVIDGQMVFKGKRVPPIKFNYRDNLITNHIGCLTAIIDMRKASRVHMPSCGHEDYATWLDILKSSNMFCIGIQEPLALYRIGNHSISSNKLKMLRFQWLILNKQRLSKLKTILYFITYIYHGMKKS